MKNLEAAECGCYRLIQAVIAVQQIVCLYLLNNYPLSGGPKRVRLFVYLSTLLFSAIGMGGAVGAQWFDDSLLYLFITCLMSYALIQAVICSQLVKSESTIGDFHCVVFIVSALMAALTFNTINTRHTHSDYTHSDKVWTWMSNDLTH